MPLKVPRWAWLLSLPLLVGAVLLMHGLDAHSGDSHPGSTTELTAHPHDGPVAADVDGRAGDVHCEGCMAGHVMVACVAIVASVVTTYLARRLLGRLRSRYLALTSGPRVRHLWQQFRPPDPVWVRLAVMRC